MKIKILGISLVITLLFSGCQSEIKNADTVKTDKEETGSVTVSYSEDNKEILDQSSEAEALEFAMNLKNGWNLGNTFDAVYENGGAEGAALSLETAWCGVYTSKELIDKVKSLGFNTIRIPVSWHDHLTGRGYEIEEKWLDRVQEVVDYAYDNDMYVILNIHHDVSTFYYYPDSDHYDNSAIYMQTIWQQLSNRFRDYDNRLIFESINEPRLVGEDVEWVLNDKDPRCIDSVETINKLNQVFVDTIRESGGNNASRYLLIPGYDTSIYGALNDGFKLPDDTASHKLIVTVHGYLPYDLALSLNGRSDFTDKDKEFIDDFMSELNAKFIQNGIPVVIGEFGILNRNNIIDRENYTAYYIQSARKNNMVCMWWDNNAFDSGETFGLINRYDNSVAYPEIINAIMNN